MKTKRILCKKPDCKNLGTKSQKGYCSKHYSELLEKSDLYYDEMK
jgi:hypothetical protein